MGFHPSIMKKLLHFFNEYANIPHVYEKSKDWAALYWFAFQRAQVWWELRMCNAGLSPMSCPLNEK